jgi:alpha-beta hydrolase superfamily lysophospholipase
MREGIRHRFQGQITDVVPVRVIHVLKVVYVNHQQTNTSAKLAHLLNSLFHLKFEIAAIRHPGQSIAKGQGFQFSRSSLYLLLGADVAEHFDGPDHTIRTVCNWGYPNADGNTMTEFVPEINFGSPPLAVS